MADLNALYRIRIADEFKQKRAKNPRYSQSAFARFLGVDTTYLSKLLKGKILLSLDLAEQITRKLGLTPVERREFLLSVAEEQRCHALYLIDPALTECDPKVSDSNTQPRSRKKSK